MGNRKGKDIQIYNTSSITTNNFPKIENGAASSGSVEKYSAMLVRTEFYLVKETGETKATTPVFSLEDPMDRIVCTKSQGHIN